MADPVTAAVIVGLAVSKFAEGAAGKTAEKLVEQLWGAIASRFQTKPKAAAELAKIEATKGKAPEAEANLVRVLDGELFEDDKFREALEKLVREITTQEPERLQEVLVGVKGRNIKAQGVSAESQSGEAVKQRVASDLEATEDIDLGSISAKQ
ncbi:MAG: hypothetical protein HC857_17010 [Synechococcales cyanobacterium RU_4_20]|nr:hypothetical protein [Synechococcales cyanobacterium RU_4_20]NJR68131.1 hypothetical protein [Synechococcales cyanobacterium CRU_2_2]